jgi:adenylate cyclase
LKRSAARRTSDMTAWDYLLRGRALLATYGCEDNAEARRLFERAIDLDPHYCDAWTGLALSHLRDIDIGCTDAREAALARAFSAARQAVALDPASSAAHLCLGQAFVWAEEYEPGIAETAEAVRLNPYNAHARMALGNRWDLSGRSREGIAEMERSLELNPRDPNRFTYMGYLSRAHLRLGEPETALGWARRMVELRPDYPDGYFRLAACFAQLDRRDEACAALARAETLRPGFVEQRAAWRPYPEPLANERFFAGLKKHGLLPT